MGKPRVIKASPDVFITDGKTTHYFPTEYDKKKAQFFLDKGANLLYALAVDYPGLYKIPLCYRDAARAELKRIGFKTSRPVWKTVRGVVNDYTHRDPSPWCLLFFLGSNPSRTGYGTPLKYATSFKIWFGSMGGLI